MVPMYTEAPYIYVYRSTLYGHMAPMYIEVPYTYIIIIIMSFR